MPQSSVWLSHFQVDAAAQHPEDGGSTFLRNMEIKYPTRRERAKRHHWYLSAWLRHLDT